MFVGDVSHAEKILSDGHDKEIRPKFSISVLLSSQSHVNSPEKSSPTEIAEKNGRLL
jgi:hypothetical protein